MKTIQCKLHSRTGASITFALLLFLICSIVSSIVIVAGTAAGGQVSQLAETDQRYYAVTSAAGLLKTVLERQSVKIVCKDELTKEATSSNGVTFTSAPKKKEMNVSVYADDVILPESKLKQLSSVSEDSDAFDSLKPTVSIIPASPPSILVDAACRLCHNTTIIYDTGADGALLPYKPDLTLSISSSSGRTLTDKEIAAASVDIREELAQDGTLKFYIYKTTPSEIVADGAGSSVGQTYTLLLTFKPVVEESTSTRKQTGTTEYIEGSAQYKRTDVEATTTTTIYHWQLTGIQKSSRPGSIG